MKNYKPIDAKVFRATTNTADLSDLGNQCAVFVGKHAVAKHCFRCLGSIFRELPNTSNVSCEYCRVIYETE